MTSFQAERTGRALLLHLTKGDDLLKCIEQGAKDAGIQSGIVTSGIGSLRKFHYHYIMATTDEPEDAFELIERPMELSSLQGIILEGKAHLHVVVSEAGNKSYSGHLEEGSEVQYLAEISILELKDFPVGRRAKDYGTVTSFAWLDGRKD
ncbi:MAG: DNA-binding protein [Oscillospiraceae bacterium]|jgi:predicted DNA-binding protein with PD1-like motif|nr:DNA-binding protein [Oscillospiraceae bacterium]